MDYRKPPTDRPAPARERRADAAPTADADAAETLDVADLGDAVERRSTTVPADDHGQRLDKRLVAMAPEFSRTYLQSLITRGHALVDGEVAVQASRRLRAGQQVTVELMPTAESLAYRPEPLPIRALYEDEHLLVLDKPAGLVVHPAPGNWSGTLLNGLLARHRGAALLPRAGIVHRLDKDTSGVMVVGRTLPAVTALSAAIAERRVHRRYLAIAQGELASCDLRIEAPIGRDPVSRVRMAVVASGKPARTDVRRVAVRGGFSALVCTLHTGRTHQIRVHLASRGHPLVADVLYGGRPVLELVRQALHATRLSFVHPVTGVPVSVHCSPPPDFARAWRAVGAGDDDAD